MTRLWTSNEMTDCRQRHDIAQPARRLHLADRVARARKALRSCELCPRRCRVDRLNGEQGVCRLDHRAHCFREMIGYNEERELTPSHQLYFAGCNLACEFCTVHEWNRHPAGVDGLAMQDLREAILRRRHEGARTVNFLGGEPSMSLYGILELLDGLPVDLRIVWNTNLCVDPLVLDLLRGIVDVYLADFKCGNAACAARLLGADDYLDVLTGNLRRLRGDADIIVRHLLLPGHRTCCTEPILHWMAEHLPDGKLSLRGNYVPPAHPHCAPGMYLAASELAAARDLASQLNLNVIE